MSDSDVFRNALVDDVRDVSDLSLGEISRQGKYKVSIIILNHNGALLLDDLLSSFAECNTYANFELIIVDHASTDGSLDTIRSWSDKIPIRIVACPENFSFSESNNRAVEVATGDVVLFVNNDIRFASDVIPRLLATLEDTHGALLGIKQYRSQPHVPPKLPLPIHHIGVRFAWDVGWNYLKPYEATSSAADVQLSSGVARFPAITASFMMCWRSDFLDVGGFCEEYVYGYEDIDLCCKFRYQLERECVSVNDVYVFHAEGATRRKEIVRARRNRHLENKKILDRRWGFALRRDHLVSALLDDGSSLGRPAKVATVSKGVVLKDMVRRLGWELTAANDADLIFVDDCDFDPTVQNISEAHTLFIGMPNETGHVSQHAQDICDLVIHERPENPESLREMLVEAIRRSLRIGLKAESIAHAQSSGMTLLKRMLQERGMIARIDTPRNWSGLRALGDDVSVIFPAVKNFMPVSNQIGLGVGDMRPATACEAHIAGDSTAEEIAEWIAKTLAQIKPSRLCAQREPSLPDLSGKRHKFEIQT